MKLSTKSTYGLRAMLTVALNDGPAAVSIAEISRKEGISIAYLEQLLNKLRRDGLIESVRGPKGGYVLSRRAADITVADIVKTLEGPINPVQCATSGRSEVSCRISKSCVPKLVWHKLSKAINDCLESVTLEDLCGEAAKMEPARAKTRSAFRAEYPSGHNYSRPGGRGFRPRGISSGGAS